MKKIILALFVLSFGFVAFGDSLSKLYAEFERRDQWKPTPQQGAVLNFLNAVKFPLSNIVALDVLSPSTSFAYRVKGGDVCAGDMIQQVVTCKNELGISSFPLDNEGAPLDVSAFVNSTSTIYKEFDRRSQLKLPLAKEAVVRFAKSLKYDVLGIEEIEIMNPSTQFVFRDRNGDFCYGDLFSSLLRCKNELGISRISFEGDSN
jgi:hypothetical protein